MVRTEDPRLQMSAVRARYNDPANYSWEDSWHRFTGAEIQRQLTGFWRSHVRPHGVVLNAGSGDSKLDFESTMTINLDVSETRVSRLRTPLIASVDAIPLSDKSVDTIVCVGSVINYCDAGAAISEFARVLRPGGHLLLEFESSRSAELIAQDAFGRSAAIADTFYGKDPETIWVYSPDFIMHLLKAAHLRVLKQVAIHVLSPWVLLFLRSVPAAAASAHLDQWVRHVPLLRRWASNHLFACERHV